MFGNVRRYFIDVSSYNVEEYADVRNIFAFRKDDRVVETQTSNVDSPVVRVKYSHVGR